MVVMCNIFRKHTEFHIICALEDLVHDACALGSVGFHNGIFLIGETPRLTQDCVIDRDLAEVMHRRCLDDIFAERIPQRERRILAHFVNEDAHAIARAPDMTARGIIAALDHHCHAEDEVVVHLHNVCGLLCDFLLQVTVVFAEQLNIALVLGVIRHIELIAALVCAVRQVTDLDEQGLVAVLVMMRICGSVLAEGFEPFPEVVKQDIGQQGVIDLLLLQNGEHPAGSLIAAEIMQMKVEGHKTGIALLHNRINDCLGYIVQQETVGND